jgi:2-C-methyl-D-erythritol 4-phosphate cytidylyltransferase
MSRAAAIIPAAGRGSRTGLKTPKTFIDLGGRPLLARTIAVFAASRRICLIQPVLPRTHLDRFDAGILARFAWSTCRPAVAGGRERQDSVAAGLRALPADIDFVVIHDGARPFATTALVERVLAAARRHGAALAAVPVSDTLKRVTPDLFLDGTVDRRALWLAQTPQAFSVGLLREAHAHAQASGFEATDDAALVEALGHPVRVVTGSTLNFKITTREDLAVARLVLGRIEPRSQPTSLATKRENSRNP